MVNTTQRTTELSTTSGAAARRRAKSINALRELTENYGQRVSNNAERVLRKSRLRETTGSGAASVARVSMAIASSFATIAAALDPQALVRQAIQQAPRDALIQGGCALNAGNQTLYNACVAEGGAALDYYFNQVLAGTAPNTPITANVELNSRICAAGSPYIAAYGGGVDGETMCWYGLTTFLNAARAYLLGYIAAAEQADSHSSGYSKAQLAGGILVTLLLLTPLLLSAGKRFDYERYVKEFCRWVGTKANCITPDPAARPIMSS